MSKSVEEQLKGSKAAEVPHLIATFRGTYFKSGGVGMQHAPYEKQVKIPLSFLEHGHMTPIGIFKQRLAPRVMTEYEGYSGVRTCRLVSCSELPKNLELNQLLNWTASSEGLAEIAKQYTPMHKGMRFKPELWPDPVELREAIRRCKAEPEVYFNEQKIREEGEYSFERKLDDELASLGY